MEKRVPDEITEKSYSSEKNTEESASLAFLGNNLQTGAEKCNKPNNSEDAKMPGGKSRSTTANLVINIPLGTASPAQKQAWGRFWQEIVIEVKKETGE